MKNSAIFNSPTISLKVIVSSLLLATLASCSQSITQEKAPELTPEVSKKQPNTLRATGDMGVIIERATGQVKIINHSNKTALAEIDGLGDLSHASIVFSRDQRYAFVFGRDGGLTKIDILKDKNSQTRYSIGK